MPCPSPSSHEVEGGAPFQVWGGRLANTSLLTSGHKSLKKGHGLAIVHALTLSKSNVVVCCSLTYALHGGHTRRVKTQTRGVSTHCHPPLSSPHAQTLACKHT